MVRWGLSSASWKVALIAAIVTAASAFLPWASIFGISLLGVEGDGLLSTVLAGVAVVLLLVARRWSVWTAALLLVGCTFVIGYVFLNVPLGFMGFGLPLGVAAAITGSVAAVMAARSLAAPSRTAGPATLPTEAPPTRP